MSIKYKGKTISGPPGTDGKSAYEYAVEGGYTGTEDEFKTLIASGPWLPTSGGTLTGALSVPQNGGLIVKGPEATMFGDEDIRIEHEADMDASLPEVKFVQYLDGVRAPDNKVCLTGLDIPRLPDGAATKGYVDNKLAGAGGPYYATCATSASTAEKTASCEGFTLKTGSAVAVKFANANSVSSPTLNVNGTGAKPIKRYGDTAYYNYWSAGSVVLFVYDGQSYMTVTAQTGDFYADVDMHNNFITGLRTPYSPSDAVNLQTLMSIMANCVDTLTVSLSGPSGNSTKTLSVPVLDCTIAGLEVSFHLDATMENVKDPSGFDMITVLYPAGVKNPAGDWSESDWLGFTLNGTRYSLSPMSGVKGWRASFPLTSSVDAGSLAGYLRCRYSI